MVLLRIELAVDRSLITARRGPCSAFTWQGRDESSSGIAISLKGCRNGNGETIHLQLAFLVHDRT